MNNYFKNTYLELYIKIKKLNLDSNIPKSFETFLTVAINYNTISSFYWDPKDHSNTLCIVYSLSLFEGE